MKSDRQLIIERQIEHLDGIAQRYGREVAKIQVFNQLVAGACWLDREFGPRLAYHLCQRMADQIATPVEKRGR